LENLLAFRVGYYMLFLSLTVGGKWLIYNGVKGAFLDFLARGNAQMLKFYPTVGARSNLN